MNLLQSLRSSENRYSLEQYAQDMGWWLPPGNVQVTQTYDGREGERIEPHFEGMIRGALKRNGVVFACHLARLLLFSEARFQWRQLRAGRPGDLFGTPALYLLERPWVNGSTGDLLARMIQDVDFAGNSYVRRTSALRQAPGLERLRPDWVTIVLGTNSDLITPEVAGYVYKPGGDGSREPPIPLKREEVAHWAPIPDPLATYRGMSWMTPLVREVTADHAATEHKLAFFEHAATPNMVVAFDKSVTPEKARAFKEIVESDHTGWSNAYKTLYMGGGADAKVVGSTMEQMSFKATQGAGETRIAAAAGVPPVIVGLSEGLAASTYSNYAQARRRFADGTVRPLWRSCAASLERLVEVPQRAQLWYDDRDIPFLQEDQKDAADIQQVKSTSIATLVREGFTAESVVAAVMAEDLSLLEHTGALSVQLLKPGESSNGSTPVPAEVE